MAGWLPALRGAVKAMQDQARKSPAGTVRVNGTVASVTPGGAADGLAQVTVTVNGSTFPAPCLGSYTPTTGDVGAMVAVLLTAGSPLILGKVQNLPAF